jgi:creatinine amidohydrolase
MSWEEVGDYLTRRDDAVLPVGSTEQHGPIGLIGTDALCATAVAEGAAARAGSVVLPPLAYAPAPFNMAFPARFRCPRGSFLRWWPRSWRHWPRTGSAGSMC